MSSLFQPQVAGLIGFSYAVLILWKQVIVWVTSYRFSQESGPRFITSEIIPE